MYLELLYILSFSYPSLYLSIHLIILIKYSLYFKRQQTRINQNSTRNLLSFHPSITFLLFVKCLLWNWYCWMEIWKRFLWYNSYGYIKPYPLMDNICERERLWHLDMDWDSCIGRWFWWFYGVLVAVKWLIVLVL